MKKIKVFTLLIASISLSGCVTKPSASSMAEYGSPTIFLEKAIYNPYCWFFTSENEGQFEDTDWIIRDALKTIETFDKISKFTAKNEDFLAYHILESHSTAGPNYAEMTIYESGYIKIDVKNALTTHGYLYYACDPVKANAAIVFANQVIKSRQQ